MRGKGEEKRINTWRMKREEEKERERKRWKEGGGTFVSPIIIYFQLRPNSKIDLPRARTMGRNPLHMDLFFYS
jgi:hypothetical protein